MAYLLSPPLLWLPKHSEMAFKAIFKYSGRNCLKWALIPQIKQLHWSEISNPIFFTGNLKSILGPRVSRLEGFCSSLGSSTLFYKILFFKKLKILKRPKKLWLNKSFKKLLNMFYSKEELTLKQMQCLITLFEIQAFLNDKKLFGRSFEVSINFLFIVQIELGFSKFRDNSCTVFFGVLP